MWSHSVSIFGNLLIFTAFLVCWFLFFKIRFDHTESRKEETLQNVRSLLINLLIQLVVFGGNIWRLDLDHHFSACFLCLLKRISYAEHASPKNRTKIGGKQEINMTKALTQNFISIIHCQKHSTMKKDHWEIQMVRRVRMVVFPLEITSENTYCQEITRVGTKLASGYVFRQKVKPWWKR